MAELSDKQRRKRRKIMSVTRRLIRENGFSKTNLEDVAAKAEVSKSTIYQLFKNKEGLLAEIIKETIQPLNESLFNAIEEHNPVRETLINYAIKNMMTTHSERHAALMGAVISESRYSPSIGKLYFESGPGLVLDYLADYFKKQITGGILKMSDPRAAAAHFLGIFHWEAQLMLLTGVGSQPSPKQIEKQAQQAVDAFLNGYLA